MKLMWVFIVILYISQPLILAQDDSPNELGVALYQEGDYTGAIEQFTLAIEAEPDNPTFYMNRGDSHFRLEQYEDAIADFNEVIERLPDDPQAYTFRGWSSYQIGDYTTTLNDYQIYTELNPTDAFGHNAIGLVYFNLDAFQLALPNFERALEIVPENESYAGNVEATQTAIDALGDTATIADDYYLMARFFHREGDFELAMENYDLALDIDPDNEQFIMARDALLSDIDIREQQQALEPLLEYTQIGLGKARDAVYSDDGTMLAIASLQGIYVYDTSDWSAEPLRLAEGQHAQYLDISPDNTQIAFRNRQSRLVIWDIASDTIVHELFENNGGIITDVTYSSDGTFVMTSHQGLLGRIWDVETGDLMHDIDHEAWIGDAMLMPNDTQIVVGTREEVVELWDIESGEQVATLTEHNGWVRDVNVSADGSLIISGGNDSRARVWDVETGEEIIALGGHDDEVRIVEINADGTQALTSGLDGRLIAWDLGSETELFAFEALGEGAIALAYHPDGTQFGSIYHSGQVYIRDATTGDKIARLDGHYGDMLSVAFSPDSSQLAVAGHLPDNTARLIDVSSGETVQSFVGHSSHTTEVIFSPDGQQVISGGADGTVRIWDASSGDELVLFDGHRDAINALAITPDGAQVLSSDDSNVLHIWDASSGAILDTIRAGSIRGLALSPDGVLVATFTGSGVVEIWDVDSGDRIHESFIRGNLFIINDAIFSADGSEILVSGTNDTVRFIDVESGKFNSDKVLNGETSALAYHPDGTYFLIGYDPIFNENIGVMDAELNELVIRLQGHNEILWDVTYSPNGQLIASGSGDGTVLIWGKTDEE